MTDYSKLVEALRCPEHDKLACPDCYHNKCYANSGKGLWCRVPVLMADAAAAIEELQQIADHHEQTAKDYWKEACEYKAQLPKRGEWIKHPEVKNIYGGVYIECPFCGEKYVVQYIADEKFCRNCGAKMEEQE